MRQPITTEKIRSLMYTFARIIKEDCAVYFTGGTTALLLGIREQTIDIDLSCNPEPAEFFQAIQALKYELDINIEAVTPGHFIPVPDDWHQKSLFIDRIGQVSFYHYDLLSQALSKIERGFAHDLDDVAALINLKAISEDGLIQRFAVIEDKFIRYPAVDVASFRNKLNTFLSSLRKQ